MNPRQELISLSTTLALDSLRFSPSIFLGTIANNPALSNLELILAEEKVKLQGVLFRTQSGTIGTVDIAGENENKTLSIFSGSQINPKVKGSLLFTFPLKTWLSPRPENQKLDTNLMVSFTTKKADLISEKQAELREERATILDKYDPNKSAKPQRQSGFKLQEKLADLSQDSLNYFEALDEKLQYDQIVENQLLYKLKRRNFSFISIGVSGEGASYNLFSVSNTGDFLVNKEKYTGWDFFGQYNILNYNLLRKRMTVHTIQLNHGKVNNVADLVSYDLIENKLNTTNADGLERKISGYLDGYLEQFQTRISYEVNFFPMDTLKVQVGFLFGGEFIYSSQSYNQMKFNMGLNFPIARKKEDKNRPFYISAIFSTLDPFNWAKASDFSIKNTALFSIRFASPISLRH